MEQEPSVVHSFDGKGTAAKTKHASGKLMTRKTILIFIGVILLGVVTGFIFAPKKAAVTTVTDNTKLADLPAGTVFGSKDEKEFSNDATGTLREGGIEGEGTHHLERPGGESQNVYLVSSVVDLSQLVGKKIKVWGKTYEPQKAGWFMDVGRAQIL